MIRIEDENLWEAKKEGIEKNYEPQQEGISTVLVVFFKNLVLHTLARGGGGEEVQQVNMFLKDHQIQPIRYQEMMIF